MAADQHAYRVTCDYGNDVQCTVLVIATSYGEAESLWVRKQGCGIPDAAKRIVRIERLRERVVEGDADGR